MALAEHVVAEGLDECRFAYPGYAGDTDAYGGAGEWREMLQEIRREALMIGAGRLHQGEGTGERAAIAGEYRLAELARIR